VKIGIVCPYSWDIPGGVQFHIRDLAAHLIGLGHQVSVLAPADDDAPLPPYVVSAGRAVPVPYNGSVARLSFGFLSAARVRRWLSEGQFDVLHLHEPGTPSLSLLACWTATSIPIVATFHTANPRSRVASATNQILQPAFEKINARIAVSEYARRFLVEHIGGDAVVIPNGVDVDYFAEAEPNPDWQTPAAQRETGGTIAFVGRFEEPRKGLPILLAALPEILAARPDTRLLVLGRGNAEEALAALPESARGAVTFLGMAADEDKARLFRSVDVYCAPNTGGESFGVILVEAMSAPAVVLAADLDAFSLVLEGGRAGVMFPKGDASALAAAAVGLLADEGRRDALREAAAATVLRYDWSVVAGDILAVYEMVTESTTQVTNEAWEAANRPAVSNRAAPNRPVPNRIRLTSLARGTWPRGGDGDS
jgi:phosphatidylinositol alpha-mannosyltransferase